MNFKEKIKNITENYGFNLNNSQIELFERYYDDLIETNKIHNLTTITEENDVIFKHFLDSILPVKLFKDNLKIIDIGCGAGFPSIPLKIINNTLNITAIDSVNKKIDFVSTEIKKLDGNVLTDDVRMHANTD